MGDNKVFEQFFKAYYDKAYYYALRILHDDEVCRDIVAESFMKVWDKAAHSGTDVRRLTPYLLTTVRNHCVSNLRKQQSADKYAQMELHAIEVFDEADSSLMERELRIQQIMQAMELLPPRPRSVIHACYVERKKYREVASEMGISESAVKKYVMQALDFLRQKFKNEDE